MLEPGKRQNGNHRVLARQRRVWEYGALLPVVLVLAMMAGCSGRNAATHDPLLGPPPKGGNLFGDGTATETRFPEQAVPPMPDHRKTSSNAAMAINTPLPGSRPLAIPNGHPQTGQPVQTHPQGQTPPPTNSPWSVPPGSNQEKPMLKQPIPVPVPQAKGPEQPAPDAKVVQTAATTSTGSSAKPAGTEGELRSELQKRGIMVLREDKVSGGVRFVCAVPHPQNPNNLRVFEATAATAAEAMTAILQRVDKER